MKNPADKVRTNPQSSDPRIERTRHLVLGSVLEELADVGYGACTIESVAARAGVAKSTIYRHWRDKIVLIADAFESAHAETVPDTSTGTARARAEQLIHHVAEVLVDSTFSRCIPALIEGAARDSRLREFHYRYSEHRRQGLTDVLREGVSNGELAEGTDVELAAVTILGALFYQRLMSHEAFAPDRACRLLDMVLPAMTPKRRRGPRVAGYQLNPIGWIESSLVEIATAPRQGDEGAPPAWLVFADEFADAIADLLPGEELIVLTWLDRAIRDELRTYPEDDENAGLHGVFSTRSPNRPNPIGLHRVTVQACDKMRILVYPLEAVDGTPVIDVKPVLDAGAEK
ncbi:MAG: tRNA (N6-threonylcarbamoyladenosine(37)-N6)-methyltransferase TrmO [Acidimicrobiales bacterium]